MGGSSRKDIRKQPPPSPAVLWIVNICEMRIALGIKNNNKNPKAILAIKKDTQTFGLIFGDKINLSESFRYPITSIPLEDE